MHIGLLVNSFNISNIGSLDFIDVYGVHYKIGISVFFVSINVYLLNVVVAYIF